MAQNNIRTRVETRSASNGGTRARVLLGDPAGQIDVTVNLVGAIAHALWQARGGDSAANWIDAEAALDQLFAATVGPSTAAQSPTQSEVKPAAARVATPTAPTPAAPVPAAAGGRRNTPRR